MSKAGTDDGGQSCKATIEDLIAVIKGTATREQKQLILDALAEPYSEISDFCREMEEWAQRLPGPSQGARGKLSQYRQSKAKERLDAVIEFVRGKHRTGVFSDEEVIAFTVGGPGSQDIEGAPVLAVECNAMATRMLRAMEKAHPELAKELATFRSDRRR